MASDKESAKEWVPPAKVEDLFDRLAGNGFANVNRPTAEVRVDKELEVGSAPYQLYSYATANGQKIGIMLEELRVDYDEHIIRISGDQFTSGFTAVNPNQKIPAMVDKSDPEHPVKLFESGGILLYLADKHKQFIPGLDQPAERAEVINWVFWQVGCAPYSGQLAHFLRFAPKSKVESIEYGVARYGMEMQRQLDVLDKQLSRTGGYVTPWGYSIADITLFPIMKILRDGFGDFLSVSKYENVGRWLRDIEARPTVQKGLTVTRE